jgi:hypothetical protein
MPTKRAAMIRTMAADHDRDPNRNDEDVTEVDRRAGDRRKPRSSFVERIGKARNRRSGKDRRGDSDDKRAN